MIKARAKTVHGGFQREALALIGIVQGAAGVLFIDTQSLRQVGSAEPLLAQGEVEGGLESALGFGNGLRSSLRLRTRVRRAATCRTRWDTPPISGWQKQLTPRSLASLRMRFQDCAPAMFRQR
jgi:hypothetical protein